MQLSLAGQIAALPPAIREQALGLLSDAESASLLHDWSFLARPAQLPPDGDWLTWLILAGRGFGKGRSGAEWIRAKIKSGAKLVHLIASTAADARDVMIEGPGGLMIACWDGDRTIDGKHLGKPLYEPSKRQVTWSNGAIAKLFSAEEPSRLRGPQCEFIWGDEFAAWERREETWDMAMFGLRLGENPQVCVTTTPRPFPLLRQLMADKSTVMTTGSTFDNAANLAPSFLKAIREKYEGTRLGQQELYAALLEEAEGALWSKDLIASAFYSGKLPEMKRVVIAIDPAITAHADSDETGIIAAGLGVDDRGYVLADRSGRYSPGDWAKAAIGLYREVGADRIVAEGNQGGEMVRHTINTEWPSAPVTIVHASRGKAARAEPIAALYEQGKISHVPGLGKLEDQLVNWAPLSGTGSPDRLDSAVWALTDLMLGSPPFEWYVSPY